MTTEPTADAALVDLINATIRLSTATEKLEQTAKSGGGVGSIEIKVNAGGIGVWLCITACVFLAGIVFMGAVMIVLLHGRVSSAEATNDVQDAYIQTYIQKIEPKEPDK